MVNHSVSLDLIDFVEKQILPRYQIFDKAHNTGHAVRVIRRALSMAKVVGADMDMVYVAAAYHDLGLEGPRAIHHLTSGRIVMADKRLLKWFTPEQIKIIKEAVEDHRASASHAPRSLYGKIVAEADRDLDPMIVFRRTVLFGLDNYPEKDKEEHWERFVRHLNDKYSVNGYIKLWIPGSENERNLNIIRRYIADETRLRHVFDVIYYDELGG